MLAGMVHPMHRSFRMNIDTLDAIELAQVTGGNSPSYDDYIQRLAESLAKRGAPGPSTSIPLLPAGLGPKTGG